MTATETDATHESPASRAGQGWCIPPTVGRFGQKLMAQQLWCWGTDVESPQGNLLMKYGFDRHRDRGDDLRSTCYRLDKSQLHVSLWGFGIACLRDCVTTWLRPFVAADKNAAAWRFLGLRSWEKNPCRSLKHFIDI